MKGTSRLANTTIIGDNLRKFGSTISTLIGGVDHGFTLARITIIEVII